MKVMALLSCNPETGLRTCYHVRAGHDLLSGGLRQSRPQFRYVVICIRLRTRVQSLDCMWGHE
jgi:hypothetical protein